MIQDGRIAVENLWKDVRFGLRTLLRSPATAEPVV